MRFSLSKVRIPQTIFRRSQDELLAKLPGPRVHGEGVIAGARAPAMDCDSTQQGPPHCLSHKEQRKLGVCAGGKKGGRMEWVGKDTHSHRP